MLIDGLSRQDVAVRGALSLVVVCAAAAAAQPAVGPAATCRSGATKIGGKEARRFCGKARANVRIAGTTYRFRSGRCDRTGKFFTVNLGIVVVGSATQKVPYFGLTVGRYPGGPAGAKIGRAHV